ncbi:DUF5723 family protein [Bacteroidales bacterium OttesenSCG-928-I14]|nr:DUF5723 family protein [Bacteroidales bacterium OttesenSCG-928-I14]
MKTIYKATASLLIIMFVAATAIAQTTNTTYFMKTSSHRIQKNPALMPEQGYVGIPVLGNIYAGLNTNTLNMDHLWPMQDGTPLFFMNKEVSAGEFLSSMAERNYLGVDVNTSILSFGFRKPSGFLHFELNLKAQADANIPYGLFDFAKNGIAMDKDSQYNFKDLQVDGSAYAEIVGGYSFSLMNKSLQIGANAKILVGLANANLLIKDFRLNANQDLWTASSDIVLDITGPTNNLQVQYDEEGNLDGVETNKFGTAGIGLGFDIGGSFNFGGISELIGSDALADVLSRFTLSAALTDIGFISWNKASSASLSSKLDDTVIIGDGRFDLNDSNTFDETLDRFEDIFDEITDFKENTPGKTTSLRTNFNVGLEYEILKDQLTVGLLSTTRFNPSHTISEFTIGGAYRPADFFELGLSYSCVHNKFDSFGLAINLCPSKGLNLFLASDYLFPRIAKGPKGIPLPTTMKGLNVLFGLSVPIGKRIQN